jgi:hypothetical protein
MPAQSAAIALLDHHALANRTAQQFVLSRQREVVALRADLDLVVRW